MRLGPKPKASWEPIWTSGLAYLVGLIATDGCLSGDGRHIDITSKDFQLLETVNDLLPHRRKISPKRNGHGQVAYFIQIGDVAMYRWLLRLGLTPRKSKTIGRLNIPKELFADFFRGVFDGDGSAYCYRDRRWMASTTVCLSVASASIEFIAFLRNELSTALDIMGSVSGFYHKVFQLRYAKRESRKLAAWIYYSDDVPCLLRKREKVKNILLGW
jgi:LAGLIDADG-like domain